MPGTKEGGIKAAATNKARHGKDFYKKIGGKGGANGNTGGFASNRELARIAGAKGGRISKRRPTPKRKNRNPPISVVVPTQRRSIIDRFLARLGVTV